jgi:hypothetical protein
MSKFKRALGLAALTALACIAFGAIASAAHAEATWVIEEKVLPEKEHFKIPSCTQSESSVLTSTVLGSALKLTGKTSCPEAEIWNEKGIAYWQGKFKLSGVTVDEPTGCKTPAEVTTNTMTGKLVENAKLGSKLGITYQPSVGETIASIKLEGCAAAGTYPLKGTMGAETEPLNVFKKVQPFKFSAAAATALGDSLKLGTQAASLTGTLEVNL